MVRRTTVRQATVRRATVRRAQAQPEPPLSINGLEISGKCYVIDGDTIAIRNMRIRLAGIDAPELHNAWGQKAKWALFAICKGQVITARISGRDTYGRAVATCHLPDGRDIGAELVKLGLALDWGIFSGGRYRHLEPSGVRRRLRHVHIRQITIESRRSQAISSQTGAGSAAASPGANSGRADE